MPSIFVRTRRIAPLAVLFTCAALLVAGPAAHAVKGAPPAAGGDDSRYNPRGQRPQNGAQRGANRGGGQRRFDSPRGHRNQANGRWRNNKDRNNGGGQRAQQRGNKRNSAAPTPVAQPKPVATVPAPPPPIVAPEPRPTTLLGRIWRNLRIRPGVRAVMDEARSAIRNGELKAAATAALPSLDGVDLGWRERRALARIRGEVFSTSLGAARTRSAAGDTVGASDAIASLGTLKGSGQIGWFGRWRAGRAEGRAFKNALKSAKRSGRHGDLSAAHDNLNFAASLRGPDDGKVLRGIGRFSKDALRAAKRFAKMGDHRNTLVALQTAAQASAASGRSFSASYAQGLMDTAYAKAIPDLVYQSKKLYKAGAHDQAAAALLEALDIQKATGIRPWLFTRWRQQGLVQALGPRIARMRAMQEAQARAEAPSP